MGQGRIIEAHANCPGSTFERACWRFVLLFAKAPIGLSPFPLF